MKKKTVNLNRRSQVTKIVILGLFVTILAALFSLISPNLTTLNPQMMITVMSTFTGFTLTALIFAKSSFEDIDIEEHKLEITFKKGAILLLFQFSTLILFIFTLVIFDIDISCQLWLLNLKAFSLYLLFFIYLVNLSDLIGGLYQILMYSSSISKGETK